MTEDAQLVHLAVDDAVATVTLDSPANRNALSAQLVMELLDHLRNVGNNDDVRVIVLTHTGTTFCAGADLAEAVTVGMERGTRALLELLRAVTELPTPVIALVRGHVRAGGLGLLGACDLVLATESSSFAFTEARLGLTPAVISLTTLSRLTERDAARKYLTGTVFDGAEAARSGLITAAVAEDQLDEQLAGYLADLRSVPKQGLAETKHLLNAPMLRSMDAHGDAMVALSTRLFGSDVAREAMTAFRERRTPRWST
jgi:enoyl-CoA hydratase/carnithine racemase